MDAERAQALHWWDAQRRAKSTTGRVPLARSCQVLPSPSRTSHKAARELSFCCLNRNRFRGPSQPEVPAKSSQDAGL